MPAESSPALPPLVSPAQPPLVVIGGATATGKTGLAVDLAVALAELGVGAEVISADSRQVYRGLDIGTAKASAAERRGITHHGLDLVDPDQPFSVAEFVDHACAALAGIAARGRVALLVGGTGLYLRAVARGLDTAALPHDPELRAELEAELARSGVGRLVERLRAVAPGRAAEVDLHNPRRVVRALELAILTGGRPRPRPRGYGGPVAWLALTVDPVAHRARIVARARAQFEAGLVEEADRLRSRFDPSLPAFSAIGYREAWAVLDGQATVEEAIRLDAARNVAFARRQRTWFRAEPDLEWLDADADPLPRALERARGLLGSG